MTDDGRDSSPSAAAGPFDGAGELGREMAARDWAATPLGPPDGWPVELRNVVRILLKSRFSMWAAWGPELTFFYNDAYRRDTLQAKHPWALGRPAREVWAEIWHDIGPRIHSVLETGVATWDEDLLLFLERSGYPEETYHTFSYSPLADGVGRTAGMLCVVTETTDRVVGERRVAHLRDLAAAVTTTRTEADVLATVGEQLGRNRIDLPFAALYLVDPAGTARLGGVSGIERGHAAAPEVIGPDGGASPWPLDRALAGELVLVDDLTERFPDLPPGPWGAAPAQGVAVPIAAGQGRAPVTAVLVVGLNPHRRWDDRYRGFVELVAGQIASGLQGARSYEAERRRAEALAELDRAKTDFFSNVSHEFRTPLTLIMGPLAELRAGTADAGSRVREELEVIERNAQRLARLVNTLLDFSRIQAGRIDARFEPADLAAVTTELTSVFRSAITRAGLSFTVDCPPLGRLVHIDRDMWEKVVLNLLSNALKFTFEGGITVRLRAVDGAAVLTVADSGIGIAADQIGQLFDRFTRVTGARARSGEGSGIGLAMVRELVGLHGGTVEVDSTPGAGTTFTVTLPFGSAHLPADRLASATRDAPAVSAAAAPFVTEALRWLPEEPGADGRDGAVPRPSGAAGRVLVADDNADMRGYLTRLLEPHYSVRAVADGRAALDAAFEDPPDLVVSDVMMPGLDGVQLLAALRGDARTSRVPVLLLSARAGQEAAVEGLAAGADDYLVKPFSAQELVARVGAHLNLGRARREAEERFTAMADLAPALIWVADSGGRRVFVNRGWTAFTGRAADDELGAGWRAGLHPQDRRRYDDEVAAAVAAGRGWEVEFRLRRGDGSYHWFLERTAPIGSPGGGGPAGEATAGWVGSCTDINARYRETERQTLLAEIGAALDRETDVPRQLAHLTRVVVDSRLADVCSVRLVGEDGRLRFAGVAGVDREIEEALLALDPDGGLAPDLVAGGAVVLHPDVTARPTDAASADADERMARLGMRSRMGVPLVVRGRVMAVLGLARRSDSPAFHHDDRALIEEIAARAALALDNAILIADERAAVRRLGLLQRVTAELSAATTPLDVAVAAAAQIRQLTGEPSRVGVYEFEEAQRGLVALTIDGGPDEAHRRWDVVPLHTPLAITTAVTERRPLWVEDLADWPGAQGGVPTSQAEVLRSFGLASTVALPLVAAGRVVGVIGIGFPQPRQFPPTERAMLLAIAEQCAQAMDRARLYRAEQGIAETLQRSLLPQRLPGFDRLALAAQYLPGAQGTSAGGDWYDVVGLDGSRVAVAVGDVVGQGPAAAAVMGQLRSALSTALLEGRSPAGALELLDRFADRLPGALASTAACLVLDWSRGTVRWARAGHPPPVLVTEGGARLLDGAGSGAALGIPQRPPYEEGTTEIEPGATVLLYTDGLVERRGEHLDLGLARVTAAAARLAGTPPGELTRRLLADVLEDEVQTDDVAVLAVRLLPPPLTGRIPSDPTRLSGVRRAVGEWAAAAALGPDRTEDLQLALGEALANAVEHAYGSSHTGECAYSVTQEADGGVRVCVEDHGRWRPPPADRGFRGRGLELIHALADDIEIGPAGPAEDPAASPRENGTAGTTVRFRLPPEIEAEPRIPVPRPAVDAGAPEAGGLPPGSPAELEVHEADGALRLEVAGEVDLAAAGMLREALLTRLAALPAGATAVLDLRRTTYLASAGIGLVLQLRVEARARRVRLHVLADPGSVPARVLALTGVEPLADPTRS